MAGDPIQPCPAHRPARPELSTTAPNAVALNDDLALKSIITQSMTTPTTHQL
jgi:hypothetical protein